MKALFTFVLSLLCFSVHSQVEAYLGNGDTIIVFENNTWKAKENKTNVSADIELMVEASVVIDEFSDAKTASTKSWIRWSSSDAGWASTYLSGKARSIEYQGVQIIIFDLTYSGDLGCLSRSSKMIIKLVNGELITLYNVGDADCGSDSQSGIFSPVELNTLSDLSSVEELQALVDDSIIKLRDNDIDKIKLTGSKYYTEQIPNEKFTSGPANQFFRQHIWALQSVL